MRLKSTVTLHALKKIRWPKYKRNRKMCKNKVMAVVLSAGKGTRFHAQKQFLQFHGKELWQHLYETLCLVLPKDCIVVVGVDIPGGETRSGSVKNGLEWIKNKGGCNKVLILEAARALVTKEQLQAIINIDSQSVCFVNPVVDTVILRDKTYLNRSDCLHLVSPQAFDFNLLYDAYKKADLGELRTDETRLMYETYGIKPDFLTGGENLFKVTYPKDIVILEEIWKSIHE